MFDLVCDGVDYRDLKALRLVSRDACAKNNDAFLLAYFDERVHLYTEDSLRVLIEIVSKKFPITRLKRVEVVFCEVGYHLFNPRLCSQRHDMGMDPDLWKMDVLGAAEDDLEWGGEKFCVRYAQAFRKLAWNHKSVKCLTEHSGHSIETR